MKPQFKLLNQETIDQILDEAAQLLQDPGVRVHNKEALALLADAGVKVDLENQLAFIPENIINQAVESCPKDFYLYDLDGERAVHYGGDDIHFDPGSSVVSILDSQTQKQRKPVTEDLVDIPLDGAYHNCSCFFDLLIA